MYCGRCNGFTGRIWTASHCVESPDIDRRVSPPPKLNGCDLPPSTRTQFSEQEYSYLAASKRHPSTLYSHNTPKAFHENPAIYFPEVNKTCVYVFGMLSGFLENC